MSNEVWPGLGFCPDQGSGVPAVLDNSIRNPWLIELKGVRDVAVGQCAGTFRRDVGSFSDTSACNFGGQEIPLVSKGILY